MFLLAWGITSKISAKRAFGFRDFKSDRFADISLNQWMALTPPQLVKEHLHVDEAMIRALHKEKSPVVKYER